MAFGVSAQELLILLRAKDEASKEVEAVKKKVEQAGKDIQKAGAIMTAAVSAPLALLAKSSLDAASSTEESLNKVRVVFGQGAKAIEDFALSAATNLGMSRQQALEASGTFGNLFVAMGIGGKEAAGMSTKLLTLAADLASFNNMDPTEVLEKLRSGLVGQTEPLRTVGVNLNQARIEAEALALGLLKPVANQAEITKAHLAVADAVRDARKETKEHGAASFEAQKARNALELAEQNLAKALAGQVPELTAAQKAQAAYSVIMKDTAKAHGDFKNTSDGLANSQRIAKASFEDVKAELGQELLPVMLEVVTVVKQALAAFKGMDPELRRAVVVVGAVVFAIGPLLGILGTIITIAPVVGGAVMLMMGPFGLLALAIGAAVFLIVRHWDELKGSLNALVGIVQALVPRLIEGGRNIVLGLWKGIQDNWHLVLGPFGGLVRGLAELAKAALDSRSPSEVFAEVGASIPAGMALGVRRAQRDAWAAAGELSRGTVEAAAATVRDGHDRLTNAAAATAAGLRKGLDASKADLLKSAYDFGATLPLGIAKGIDENKPVFEIVARNALQELGVELRRMAADAAEMAKRAATEAAERARDIARSPLPPALQGGPAGRGGVWADPQKDPTLWRAQMLAIGLNPDTGRDVRKGDPLYRGTEYRHYDPFDPTMGGKWTILPNRHSGGYVPHTGPYVLEKGEHVLSRNQGAGGMQIGPFVINGTVVDLDALGERVRAAVTEGKRRGGFHGVLAEGAAA